ncbi:MAG: hypothetical protein CR972_03855 [Candidatus Moraniibacteriota bacterium]|nr:MAG: hypothetical protein CR972_03855 [Candidatus Moranbacteria bacterium]
MIYFVKKRRIYILAISVFIASFSIVSYFVFFYGCKPQIISVKMHHVQNDVQDFPEIEKKQNIIENECEKKESDGIVVSNDIVEGSEIVVEKEKEKYKPFKFAIIGDSEREKSPYGFGENAYGVFDHVKTLYPDFVLFTGDIIMANADSRGPRVSIRHVRKVFDKYFANIPYYIVFGYHDVECGVTCVDLWQEYFSDHKYIADKKRVLHYSFDYENTHFVILSTDWPTKRTIKAEQLSWLEKDLEKNKLKNVIVATHVPPVTFYKKSAKNCHDFACQPELQRKLQYIFKNGGVDLVISGHEAVFDHKIVDGIHYILSGNTLGGKAKYKGVKSGQTFSEVLINGSSIIVRGIDMEDGLLREIKVR